MKNANKEEGSFSFKYSAREQAEIKKIREKYTGRGAPEDKMARLRRLDASVTGTAQSAAIAIGIIGALILGFGMSLVMTELSSALGMTSTLSMILGIVIGIVGGVIASLAYPAYSAILKAMKKRVAPEILRLTDELMQ